MNAIRSFVVAAREPISARLAFQRARLLAHAGDKIVLAHVERGGFLQLLGEGELRHAMPDGQLANWTSTSWLEELGRAIDTDPAITVQVVLLRGNPALVLGDYACSIGAAAIIVAAHREGILRGLAFGSTALRILRHSPCPVLVARDSSVSEYQTAVAAVDIDPASQRVLATTRDLLPQTALSLLHVYRLREEGQLRLRGLSEHDLAPVREQVRAEAERGMASLQATVPLASINLAYGLAGSEILSFILSQRSDILVISQHRGPQTEERVLGSVTQFLLYNCPCDLLLVP